MSEDAYRGLLTILMLDDPSALPQVQRDALVNFANDHALTFDFNDWIEAYHHFGGTHA